MGKRLFTRPTGRGDVRLKLGIRFKCCLVQQATNRSGTGLNLFGIRVKSAMANRPCTGVMGLHNVVKPEEEVMNGDISPCPPEHIFLRSAHLFLSNYFGLTYLISSSFCV